MPTPPIPITANAFARLRLRYGASPEAEELPAVIEHDFADGRMVDHYLARPAAGLLAMPAVQALGPLCGALFLQESGGEGWRVELYNAGMRARAVFALPEAEFRRLLAANALALPGEPGFTAPEKSD